jgi:hypothetical protein
MRGKWIPASLEDPFRSSREAGIHLPLMSENQDNPSQRCKSNNCGGSRLRWRKHPQKRMWRINIYSCCYKFILSFIKCWNSGEIFTSCYRGIGCLHRAVIPGRSASKFSRIFLSIRRHLHYSKYRQHWLEKQFLHPIKILWNEYIKPN